MKNHSIALLMGMALIFSGCSGAHVPATKQQQAPNTTLVGTLIKTGTTFAIQAPGKPLAQVDSYTQKFDAYVGKKVSVTGQYSGTTLFVDVLSIVQ